jgi:prepilin-type N-terminal cleavage/methylation domain-containing protein
VINKIKGDERGLSLTEIIIAMIIFAVVGSSVMFALNASSKTIISAHEITTAESLTRSLIEYIKRSEYDATRYEYDPGSGKVNVTLNGSIDEGDTSINISVNDLDSEDDDYNNLDDLDFPSSGIIQIEEELIYYASQDGSSFDGCERGYLHTEVAAHASGAAVLASPPYYEAPDTDICQAAGIILADAPYYSEYTVETGILRLECQYPSPDTTRYRDDDGLQKIFVMVKYQGIEVLTTESYMVKR